jgi:hypothetical protein
MNKKTELEDDSQNDFLSSFSGEMITNNKTVDSNSTKLDDEI